MDPNTHDIPWTGPVFYVPALVFAQQYSGHTVSDEPRVIALPVMRPHSAVITEIYLCHRPEW